MSLNIVVMQGRLVRDPSVKKTESGLSVTTFTIAVDRQKKGEADFVDCTAWRQTADFVGNYFCKGDMILVNGRLQSRKWQDKEGNNRTAWEIVVDGANFCGGGGVGKQSSKRVDASDFEELDDSGELPF